MVEYADAVSPGMKRGALRRRKADGMVLVMALMVIAIITVLLVALFEGATMQTRLAQGSGIIGREEMLADSAAALVESQIAQASTQPGQTWISQPGLVRTYNATGTRAPTACYKLYSTPSLGTMTDTSGSVSFMSADVPTNWISEPALYTDLNSPDQTASGQTVYPIFDPSATNAVQGVSIDAPNTAQMPVAWLYQLQDGTLGPAGNATAANPIVARLAFWTDDDTAKINVNTAGYGASWNTPRVNSSADIAAGNEQPAQGEYSAYPGHPATTSLNVVFGSTNAPSLAQEQQWLGMAPRYASGGSQFGTQTTTPGEIVPMATGHLYASLDELLFSPGPTNSAPRLTNSITPQQIERARFVLTAHSVAPETTLLGEPRVAIWPIADSTAKTTAFDRAIATAATVGARDYFFQRNNPLNPLDDFTTNAASPPANAVAAASNLQLFNDLVNRGNVSLPGYGTAFTSKYSGAAWTQVLLEIADYIHALNAVDPSGAPFAAAGATGAGCGFVDPLTTTYGSGASALSLRGLGRCPMLSSLTIVFYVSGFTSSTGTIDFEAAPDNAAGAVWNANFGPGSTQWSKLNGELVRAFVIPCTFQPGCGYPEVSDACKIQIQGLNNITVSAHTASGATRTGGFGFPAVATSLTLGTPLKYYSDRAWGGNEGPLAWMVTADALAQGQTPTYAFAGTSAFAVPMTSTSNPYGSSAAPSPASWPGTKPPFTFNGVTLTVLISDLNGNTLQTNTVTFPAFSLSQAPTILGEADHADTVPSTPGWSTNSACAVAPSWYMTLAHRLQTSTGSRGLIIQAGDICRSVETAGDWRVAGALPSVPSTLFQTHPLYNNTTANLQGGSQALNLRFADGTSACFAPGNVSPLNNTTSACNELIGVPYAAGTNTVPVHDWRTSALLSPNGATQVTPYTLFTNAPCGVPTGTQGAYLSPGVCGDWATGPGLAPDGAQINLPDAGTTNSPSAAYFSLNGGAPGAPTQRTPGALVPSPVIFGSLPAGINPASPANSVPWRTLLFCPYPAANTSATPYANHPGAASPPDYLILDNFWMPVVEPYAISSCLATRGKVNLNDQIAPFTWIHRSTALRALLDTLRIPAIPSGDAAAYKAGGAGVASIWNPVDLDATVAQIENRFAAGSADAYLSESEICAVPLVPKMTQSLAGHTVAATQANLAAFWNPTNFANLNAALTGDNLRELPYAQIYGRLATRSNSYTVHVWVQVLKKIASDPNQNVWNPATDLVLGEWRGSYEIERYLNPAAVAPAAGSPLGPYYFRVVGKRRFAP